MSVPANISTATPTVYNYIQSLAYTPDEKLNLFLSTIDKVQSSYDKLNSDMNNRISQTVRIFKACRLFNYRFVWGYLCGAWSNCCYTKS